MGESKPGGSVLVVEDEGLIRMLLVDDLVDAGFEVIEAENADVAVELLGSNANVQIVITDIRMPGSIDGLGLANWMRDHRPGLPIIITSGFANLPDAQAINPAIIRVVPKPYSSRAAAGWCSEVVGSHRPV